MRIDRHGNVAVQLQQICKFFAASMQIRLRCFSRRNMFGFVYKTGSTIAAAFVDRGQLGCLKYQHGGEAS